MWMLIPKWSFNASILFMVWVYWSSNANWASTRQKKTMIKMIITSVYCDCQSLIKSSSTDSLNPARERIWYLVFEKHLIEGGNVMNIDPGLWLPYQILHLKKYIVEHLTEYSELWIQIQVWSVNHERERERDSIYI